MDRSLRGFPGGDLVAQGLADLGEGLLTEAALLVLAAAPRLRGLGLAVPERLDLPFPHEHALFDLIERRNPRGAHAAYNAHIGRVVSFAQAYVRAASCGTPQDAAQP